MASFDTEFSSGLEDAVFDYFIVGGGTSGLVVADRLSEDPNVRVIVLEAGTNRLDDPRITIPGLGIATFEDPDFVWNFRSIPQGMKYDEKSNGTDGPVNVSFGDQYMPYHSAWLETFKGLGYPQVEDLINGARIGPFVTPGSIDPVTNTRSHSGVAYLGPDVQARSNLRVVTGALVEKVVKDQKGFTVSAQREGILAAGTTQTPQILELSGIGRSSVLQAHGITPIIDHAGVGENLQDYGIVPLVYEVADGLPSGDMARDPAVAAAAMAAYQKDGSGPLGMVPFISAFMPCADLTQPELEKILLKIEESIKNPETSITHRKQFEVLQGLIKDPEEATAQ
ncbi:uncharacterized protein N7473_010711 [Penicillium subrubescens]|uniref:uncharacterized protein n=1 Tax=Penicillium subrubescens TaxID=1316194 RepID=UPI0025459455|nr:uncharacterized protein N7473_010711 [Penicillium subrubescens]KAJ5883825.1 hypothetical protein N7473_010711 [Penicillium subrubescens]